MSRNNGKHDELPDPYSGPNREAERALLCSMMLGHGAVKEARGLVRADHFHFVQYGRIFEALLAIADQGEEPTFITLTDELQKRGQLEAVGGTAVLTDLLLQYASARENLPQLAKIVRERSTRRATRELGRALIDQSQDVTRPVEEILDLHRKKLREAIEDHGAINRRAWMDQIVSLGDLLTTVYEPIESIIGEGLLPRGAYAVFAGHSELGKTYLTIQMMAAILSGDYFLGQKCRPCRIGMLEFEMPEQAMQARAKRFGLDLAPYGNGADLLCMPKGRWYFNVRDTVERIVDWCGERELGLLIPDPLNRTLLGDPNDAETASEWLDNVHEIRERTGTTIMVVQHVRKLPASGNQGPRTSSTTLDSVKGPGRYVEDADTVFMLDEKFDGNERFHRFSWAKTRFGQAPPDQLMKRQPNGFFLPVESPTIVRLGKEDQLREALKAAWTMGLKPSDVETLLEVSDKTALNVLKKIGAVSRGKTSKRRFFVPAALAELEPELTEDTDATW